eukprot:scpid78838/ scgid22287/ 
MLARIALLLACGLVAAEAIHSTRRPPAEFISSECYGLAQPFLASIQEKLHERRQHIREGCHDEAYLLGQEALLSERSHNRSIARACSLDKHSDFCKYLMSHLPLGNSNSKSFVAQAGITQKVCHSRLKDVVDIVAAEVASLTRVLGKCAPKHACYVYEMTQDYKHHAAKHIRHTFHVTGRASDICTRSAYIPALVRPCERFAVAQRAVQRIQAQWESIFSPLSPADCDRMLTATTGVTDEATTPSSPTTSPPTETAREFAKEVYDRVWAVDSATVSSVKPGVFDGKRYHEWLQGLKATPESHLAKEKTEEPPTSPVAEEKPGASKTFKWPAKHILLTVSGFILVAGIIFTLMMYCTKERRQRIIRRTVSPLSDAPRLPSKGPLATEDERDLEAIMYVKQHGFENPTYSFYEDLEGDEVKPRSEAL